MLLMITYTSSLNKSIFKCKQLLMLQPLSLLDDVSIGFFESVYKI